MENLPKGDTEVWFASIKGRSSLSAEMQEALDAQAGLDWTDQVDMSQAEYMLLAVTTC